jgi:TM2 domain-containing membrane protein YozV
VSILGVLLSWFIFGASKIYCVCSRLNKLSRSIHLKGKIPLALFSFGSLARLFSIVIKLKLILSVKMLPLGTPSCSTLVYIHYLD